MKKKLLLLVTFVVASIAAAYAQPRAIGIRQGYGTEVSYEHGLGNNMLSIDFGIVGYAGLEAAVTYDWIDPFGATIPWSHKGEWHWYMGVGGAVAWYWPLLPALNMSVGAAGRFGIEYDFWFPLQLSFDWRPVIGPTFYAYDGEGGAGFNTGGLYAGAICLGVRYKF